MIGGFKTIIVKAGREKEFERLFSELREQMRQHEPECRLYSLLKSQTNPRAYFVQEQYTSQAAHDFHEASAHGAEYFPQIRALLEEITAEYFEVVVE